MKKFLLFSFLLLIGAYSSVTWGAQETINGVTWTVDGMGRITACADFGSTVTVPDKVSNITVTGFHDGFASFMRNTTITAIDMSAATSLTKVNNNFCLNATNLTSVIFSAALTDVGTSAFDGCTNLSSATLPNTVTTIGRYAFRNCPLIHINVPTNLNKFDSLSFKNCKDVVTIDWNANISVPTTAFNYRPYLTTVNFYGTFDTIYVSAFDGCTSLSSATLPASVTTISALAFKNCPLTHITFPTNLESYKTSSFYLNSVQTIDWNSNIKIPDNAFQNATTLVTVNFNGSVEEIGQYAFDGCTSLSVATLPNSVTTIGKYAFRNCPLTYIKIPVSLTSFDSLSFRNCNNIQTIDWNANIDVPATAFAVRTNLTTVNFNGTFDTIKISAFDGCTNLSLATLPNSVRAIGKYAFRNCPLTYIKIPVSLTSFDSLSFKNCNNIQTIDWNANISVPNTAFTFRTNLTNVNFNGTFDSIGHKAFLGCTNLSEATIPDGVQTISSYAFANCSITTINIPTQLTTFNASAFDNNNIQQVDWNANCEVPTGAFLNKSTLTTVNFRNTDSINIQTNAFKGCANLATVNFENAIIKIIYPYSFDGCASLTSANFADGITAIRTSAFNNCNSLVSLRIPSSITEVSATAFSGVYSLKYLEWNSSKVRPVSFKDNVNLETVVFNNKEDLRINSSTFMNCSSLTSLDLGTNIGSIGDNAFYNCGQLDSVVFKRTDAPSFGVDAFANGPADRKYYIPCKSYKSYTIASYTPCNATNTIEDCRGSDQPTYTIGTVTVDHDMVCNLAEINRSMYTSDAQITVSGNYKLDANALKINWEFDAQHFYYFTLPFDCNVSAIDIDNETVKTHYITDWDAAVASSEYNNGGFQILEHNESRYAGGTSGNKVYTGVAQNGVLKAGVAYMFALLNPVNVGGAAFKVTATFNKADSYSFNNNIEVNAPSSCTGDNQKRSGFNLYGNPFYWNIPISNFGVQSANVVVPATNSSYATVQLRTGSEFLLPGEALFVQRANASDITFTSNPGSAQAPAQYSNQRPIRLNLSHNGTADDYTYIKSDVEADDHYVVGEDCCKMKNAGKNQIYTMVNDTIETAFNCLNLEGSVCTIPVGLTTVNSGTFQIAVADGTIFMPGTIIKLRDTQNGAEYNLLNGPASITLGKGITDGRYVIDIMDIPCGNETIAEESTLSAFVRDGQIVVEGVDSDAVVKVYDAAGRLVTSFTANADVVSFAPVASGVYFVNVSGQTIKIVY